jgi:hypothetical protein
MTHSKNIVLVLVILLLISCGGTTYKLIGTGVGQSSNTKFNIKHVLDCCGCSGVLVNTFQDEKLQAQLFVESNEACPYLWTKFNFHYAPNGTTLKVDTLVAVADGTWTYPVTEIDKLALAKIDSFIAAQNSTMYHVRKIDITGYRDKNNTDNKRLMSFPRLDKHALY